MLTGFETSVNRFAVFGKAANSIRWTGRPRSGLILRSSDLLLIPFSLLWGGFAIFWESMAVTTEAPIFFKLWGIPFVLVGLYFIFGRFIFDAYVRSNTWYALTDDSALILRAGFGTKMSSVYLPTVEDITLEAQGDNRGTIYFGRSPSSQGPFEFFSRTNVATPPAFECIENAAGVYDKCQQAQRWPKPSSLAKN